MSTSTQRKNWLLTLILGVWVAGAWAPLLAQTEAERETRIAGPIGGAEGQTLRVSVAVLPTTPKAEGLVANIEIYSADGTDLEPLAVLRSTPVAPGRSLVLDYELGRGGVREEVIVRLDVSGREPDFTASVQIFDTAKTHNTLWGDWYIVRD
ncbi:MAG: hypothetical protein AAF657_15725 [Acidobacteriota bacterium]